MDCRVVMGFMSGLYGCGGVVDCRVVMGYHEWIVGLWWGT